MHINVTQQTFISVNIFVFLVITLVGNMKSKLTTHLLVSWFLSILSESSEHVIPKKKVDNVNQQAKAI